MSLAFYLNILIGGLLTGLVYGLAALGFAVIFGALRVVNFAHGGMMVAGKYATALVMTLHGTDPLLALPVDAVGLFVFGFLFQSLLAGRVRRLPEPMPSLLLVGVALMLAGGLSLLFGAAPRSARLPIGADTLALGPLVLDRLQVRAAWVAVLMITLLFVFFNISRTGKAIRACADNPCGARVIGLNVSRLQAVTFGLGSAVVGVAGCLMAQTVDVRPELVSDMALTGFVVILIGGPGSAGGALLGGLLVGMVEALAGALVSPALQSLAGYGLLLVVLVLRSLGLPGRFPNRSANPARHREQPG
jgi:branched-chain amino acid transport system permease protein